VTRRIGACQHLDQLDDAAVAPFLGNITCRITLYIRTGHSQSPMIAELSGPGSADKIAVTDKEEIICTTKKK
jgi:hypothetical protein